MKTLSLTMIVKNEEKFIERCLNSVKNIVAEMIVVDTGSTDRTTEIAEACGAKVFDYKWNDNFADARNFALQQSTGDWNLVLDADEYLTGDYSQHINELINGKEAIGRIKIVSKYMDMDKNEIRHSQIFVSRIFPKGVYYSGRIHEQVVSDLPHVRTEIVANHDGYFQTDKTDRNLHLLQMELHIDPNNPYLLYQIAKEHKNKNDHAKAEAYYAKSYTLVTKDEGYFPSLVVDYLYSLIATKNLTRAYEIIQTEQARLQTVPGFHFVSGLFYMDYILSDIQTHVDKLDLIEKAFLTCLELGDSNRYDSVVGTGSYLASYNLGVLYEVVGDVRKAEQMYNHSANYDYQPAVQRLRLLNNRQLH